MCISEVQVYTMCISEVKVYTTCVIFGLFYTSITQELLYTIISLVIFTVGILIVNIIIIICSLTGNQYDE